MNGQNDGILVEASLADTSISEFANNSGTAVDTCAMNGGGGKGDDNFGSNLMATEVSVDNNLIVNLKRLFYLI